MLKKLVSVFTCLMLITAASLAIAGGPPAPPQYAKPCPPAGGPAAAPSPYWGDAPFPGLCGGVVALPFLVVGSLLGGNPAGPPPPPPAYGYGAPPPRPYPAPYGAQYAPPGAAGGSLFGGLPCMEMCTGLMGSITGSQGLL